GKPVRDAETWFKQRRPELLKLYETEIYGRVPANAPTATFKVIETDTNALDGLAVRKLVELHFTGRPEGSNVQLHVYLPAKAAGPVPVLLQLVFNYNLPGPVVASNATPPGSRAKPVIPETGPLKDILARGYGYATFRYTEVQLDSRNTFSSGIINPTLAPGQTRPAPDEWGTISAWAWAASRALDYLATDRAVDASRVALIG